MYHNQKFGKPSHKFVFPFIMRLANEVYILVNFSTGCSSQEPIHKISSAYLQKRVHVNILQ